MDFNSNNQKSVNKISLNVFSEHHTTYTTYTSPGCLYVSHIWIVLICKSLDLFGSLDTALDESNAIVYADAYSFWTHNFYGISEINWKSLLEP